MYVNTAFMRAASYSVPVKDNVLGIPETNVMGYVL